MFYFIFSKIIYRSLCPKFISHTVKILIIVLQQNTNLEYTTFCSIVQYVNYNILLVSYYPNTNNIQ